MSFTVSPFCTNTGSYDQQPVSGLISNLLKLTFTTPRGAAGSGGDGEGNMSGRGESGSGVFAEKHLWSRKIKTDKLSHF